MNLAQFPRRRYTEGQTPLEFLPRLTEALDGPNIWIKRDDMLGLAGGGNKTRKLEFLVADALAKGADTLITCGAVQSNHARLTLAAACKEGMPCHLVIEERVSGSYNENASGNNFLFHLMGVAGITVVPGGSNMMEAMEKVAEDVRKKGGKPYIIPGGGSNAVGSLGYVACAEEILEQAFDKGLNIDCVVCTSGSGGTHGGLAVGFWGNNTGIPVVGINISRPNETQRPIIIKDAVLTAARFGLQFPEEIIECVEGYVGSGYSLATSAMVEAVRLMARTEAILLDPVYTGKSFSGLIGLIRQGRFKKGENVVFVHTGGSPALYHYKDYFAE
ncbi:D-cysteine desulfhydrase [Pelosinus sp. UFO1]|uniref:D-cysteine desulfhydrase n=1 Tax=Pelosinus sp. UFO1 TaxID=484770 RepID=UPI0004D1C884|nr:D-cysteine desulfhydrase [Pelosinus sp. UFO1]AIF51286.1 pyridoxal phosphate-dependent enzyme, D-cysteine desulfhydrase family [Pelosinus sp. UFO1]